MPSVGTPARYTARSMEGAPSTCTDAGPPLKMIPAGLRSRISSAVIVCGTISEYTCASRTRRAMSWAYCAPKSTTRTTCSGDDVMRGASVPHADALRALQSLAFGLQRGGDHDL